MLEVIVNGRDTSKIGEFVERDGMVFARPQELEALGFRVPAGAAAPDGLVPLASLPGMQYRVERTSQSLLVTAPDAALLPALLGSGLLNCSVFQVETAFMPLASPRAPFQTANATALLVPGCRGAVPSLPELRTR